MTVGLYYDIATGPQNLINEANKRFEDYAILLIKSFYSKFKVLSSEIYGTKKKNYETPDILLKNNKEIFCIIECKATKLTFDSQFKDNPLESAAKSYSQIIKGVMQVWKFFSHSRRGIYNKNPVQSNAYGIVLTLDSWMQMSGDLQRRVMNIAKENLKTDTDIIDTDMRPIIFCSMQDLSDIMFTSSEDKFLETLENASMEKFLGWNLKEIREKSGSERQKREYPLDISELLPWWKTLDNKI
ncbi:hypothetical protein [Oceanibaculum pacificum]|uniref:hypothetical protein n=1 Tax=Oceanibaculum pacificum TaxID=580166 RepID=UPI0012EDC27E|nr:hypothetical protein [Oceanibaculum pacificum]